MSKRDLHRGSGAQGRGHTGDNFDIQVGIAQRFNFFSSSPEDKRVSSFQTHYLQIEKCVIN